MRCAARIAGEFSLRDWALLRLRLHRGAGAVRRVGVAEQRACLVSEAVDICPSPVLCNLLVLHGMFLSTPVPKPCFSNSLVALWFLASRGTEPNGAKPIAFLVLKPKRVCFRPIFEGGEPRTSNCFVFCSVHSVLTLNSPPRAYTINELARWALSTSAHGPGLGPPAQTMGQPESHATQVSGRPHSWTGCIAPKPQWHASRDEARRHPGGKHSRD